MLLTRHVSFGSKIFQHYWHMNSLIIRHLGQELYALSQFCLYFLSLTSIKNTKNDFIKFFGCFFVIIVVEIFQTKVFFKILTFWLLKLIRLYIFSWEMQISFQNSPCMLFNNQDNFFLRVKRDSEFTRHKKP